MIILRYTYNKICAGYTVSIIINEGTPIEFFFHIIAL